MALLEHSRESWVLGALAWSIPALLALLLWSRGAPGARAAWLVVAFVTGCFALDKAVDLHAVLRSAGQTVVAWLDPATHFRGKNVIYRIVLLGALFVSGLIGLWLFWRADRLRTRAKLTSLAGLVLAMGYLGLRFVPRLGKLLERVGFDWAIEIGAWLLVVGGELASLRRSSTTDDDY